MAKDIRTEVGEKYVHFFLEESYLGMLVHEKGELSDFRAIVRKNKLTINRSNARKTLETCLYELLTHFLIDREFVEHDQLQNMKMKLVRTNAEALDSTFDRLAQKLVN